MPIVYRSGKDKQSFPRTSACVLSHHVDFAAHVLGGRLHAGQYMANQFFLEIFRSQFDDSISWVGCNRRTVLTLTTRGSGQRSAEDEPQGRHEWSGHV